MEDVGSMQTGSAAIREIEPERRAISQHADALAHFRRFDALVGFAP